MKNDFRDRESENCFSDFSGKIEFCGYAFWCILTVSKI